VNLRKDHYRIDRRVVVSATAAGNDSRSSLERARRRTLCIQTAAVLGAAPRKGAAAVDSPFGGGQSCLQVLASGYLSRLRTGRRSSASAVPACRRARRRTRVGDGRGEHGRTASVGGTSRAVGVVRGRPCEVQRVARARLDRP